MGHGIRFRIASAATESGTTNATAGFWLHHENAKKDQHHIVTYDVIIAIGEFSRVLDAERVQDL